MANRTEIDWEKGEKLYRLGQLSAAEIGKQLSCSTSTITRHMDKCGIKRDKSDEVRRRTKEAIATQRNAQRNATEVTEEDIQGAVDNNLALVMSHRKDLTRLGEIENKLLEELDGNPTKLYITQFQGEIVQETICLTVTEKASTLSSLCGVMAKRIEKQRQAFSIDDDEKDKDDQVIVQLSTQDAKL